MPKTWEERTVKIAVTPDGAPAIWESGGLLQFEGTAVIVANPTGGKPYASELRSEICGAHALARVGVGYYVIVATVRRRVLVSMQIDRIVEIRIEGKTAAARVQRRARWTPDGWDREAQTARLEGAISAVKSKVMTLHCRSAAYVTAPPKPDVVRPRLVELRSVLTELRRWDRRVPAIKLWATQFSLSSASARLDFTGENLKLAEQAVTSWRQSVARQQAGRHELKRRLDGLRHRLNTWRRNDRSAPKISLYAARFSFGDVPDVPYTEDNVRATEESVERWEQGARERRRAAEIERDAARSRSETSRATMQASKAARRDLEPRLKELRLRLSVLRRADSSVPYLRFERTGFTFGDILVRAFYTEENVKTVLQKVESLESEAADRAEAEKSTAEQLLSRLQALRGRLAVLRRRNPAVPKLKLKDATFDLGAILTSSAYTEENVGLAESHVAELERANERRIEAQAEGLMAQRVEAKRQRREGQEQRAEAAKRRYAMRRKFRRLSGRAGEQGIRITLKSEGAYLFGRMFAYNLEGFNALLHLVHCQIQDEEDAERWWLRMAAEWRRAEYNAARRASLTARYKLFEPRARALGWALELGGQEVRLLGADHEAFPYTELGLVAFEEALERGEEAVA